MPNSVSYESIRSCLTAIAAIVATVTAIAFTGMYLAITYDSEMTDLRIHTELGADVVSTFIYLNPRLWQYEQNRIEEKLARLNIRGHQSHHQRILDIDGNIVVALGEVPDRPTVIVTRELTDGIGTVGRLELAHSLRPIMKRGAMVLLLGFVLGLAMYIVLRALPLRALVAATKDLRAAYDDIETLNRTLEERVERRTAELSRLTTELGKSEELFRTVINHSPTKIHIKDTEGRYVLINRQSEILFGATDEEARGKTATEIFSPEVAADFARHDQSVLEAGQVVEQEEEWPSENGIRTYLTVKFPILGAGGCITGIGAIGTDITERKKSDQVLRTAMAEAEEAKKLALSSARNAAAASQAKSDFLANMSHELRTPLNAMLGFAEMIEKQMIGPLGSEEYGEYAKIIVGSGRHLLTVINDILDFSRIEAGKLKIDSVPFDLAHVTDGTIELLASAAHDKAIVLACFVGAEVPMSLIGDPGRLRQILLNLVGNAIKFTNTGGVKVEVSLESVGGNEVFLRFEICDTGIGVDLEVQERLFDKFCQADVSTTREYGGTGLGLPISKKIVELMNGEIGVDSRLGRGSTFWFTVSLAKQANEGKSTLAEVAESTRGRRVLVVDDNSINRLVAKKYFEMLGAEVTTVTDAQAALSALAGAANEAPFELAIIDHMMPDIDGEELGRRIRAEARYDELMMVLSSSSGLVHSHRSARDFGFEGALPKPLCRTVVLDCLSYLYDVVFPRAGAEAPEDLVPASGHFGLHILVAEDNIVNQRLLDTMLRSAGHEVDIANDGQEAVKAVREHAYDLVLMDVHMPNLNGLEATRVIRQMPGKAAEVPIIAVTAAVLREDREKCHQAGMSDFVSKPIDIRQLFERIAFWTGTDLSSPTEALEENNEGSNPNLSEDAAAALDDLLDSIDEIAGEPVGQKLIRI